MDPTPLFEAIHAGDLGEVSRILAARPEAAGASDGSGLSALTVAAYRHQWAIVDRILAAGPELDVFEAAIVGDAGRVRTLLDGTVAAGTTALSWDGHADRGSLASSGVYFARATCGSGRATLRIPLVR